jgi:hypothetical protein
MTPPEPPLPPLSDAARLALAAFRDERPSPGFEARLATALEAAALEAEVRRARARSGREGRWGRGLLVVAGLALAGAFGSALWRRPAPPVPQVPVPQVEVFPERELVVNVPPGGGAWVHLPWHLHQVHSGGLAFVRLDAPVGLEGLAHGEALPIDGLTHCEGARCTHQWEASSAAPERPLRVRVPAPGRYALRVQHASGLRVAEERFVVIATP